jgi:hypothetical protein
MSKEWHLKKRRKKLKSKKAKLTKVRPILALLEHLRAFLKEKARTKQLFNPNANGKWSQELIAGSRTEAQLKTTQNLRLSLHASEFRINFNNCNNNQL